MKTFAKAAAITLMALVLTESQAWAAERTASVSSSDNSVQVKSLTNGEAERWYYRARTLAKQWEYKAAIAACDRALASDPKFSSAYQLRGDLKRHSQMREAKEDFDKCLSLEPTNADCWRDRAILREELNDDKGALSDLNSYLALKPDDPIAMASRSQLKMRLGDKIGAFADADKAISLAPSEFNPYYNRSMLLAQAGDRIGAWRDHRHIFWISGRKAPGMPGYILKDATTLDLIGLEAAEGMAEFWAWLVDVRK